MTYVRACTDMLALFFDMIFIFGILFLHANVAHN